MEAKAICFSSLPELSTFMPSANVASHQRFRGLPNFYERAGLEFRYSGSPRFHKLLRSRLEWTISMWDRLFAELRQN